MIHESKQLRDECRDDWLEDQLWNTHHKWLFVGMITKTLVGVFMSSLIFTTFLILVGFV